MNGITNIEEVWWGAYLVQRGKYHRDDISHATIVSCHIYWTQFDFNIEWILVNNVNSKESSEGKYDTT